MNNDDIIDEGSNNDDGSSKDNEVQNVEVGIEVVHEVVDLTV